MENSNFKNFIWTSKLHKFNQTDIENNIDLRLKNLSNMLNEIKISFSTRNSEKQIFYQLLVNQYLI